MVEHIRVRLADLAHKNTRSPVKLESRINEECDFNINALHAIFGVCLY